MSPSINLANNATVTLADLAGPGVIRHLWLTTDLGFLRRMVLRMYWDDAPEPSVEVPLGDFFCNGWGEPALVNSDMVVVAPVGGLNSYWPMPFRGRGRITLENLGVHPVPVYYQITYTEHELPANIGYLHASWRRSRPLGHPAARPPGRAHGAGQGARPRPLCRHLHGHPGWWGEGEVKFYLDGDDEFPTICGTGTEDYFGGAWNFDVAGSYVPYSTPYLGLHQVLPPGRSTNPTSGSACAAGTYATPSTSNRTCG